MVSSFTLNIWKDDSFFFLEFPVIVFSLEAIIETKHLHDKMVVA